MKFLIGRKKNMTQIFDKNGIVHPVTVLEAGPIIATQIKGLEKDGYLAVQFGYGQKKESRTKKAQKGHTKDLGNFQSFKEYRFFEEEMPEIKVGDKFDVSIFEEGSLVDISSISKGKGFQGVVKRHNFGGGRRTHGQKHSEREPGSIGGGGRAGGRVAKGLRMAGRMGGDRITVKKIKVVDVDSENNLIYLLGSVPGRKGTLVEITGIEK